jgi:hypothetical protein
VLENVTVDFGDRVWLLVIGFTLTGIVGAVLNWLIQSAIWKRQKKHDLLEKKLHEGQEVFEKISDLLSRRSFGLQRVIWSMGDSDKEAKEKVWGEYYEHVKSWNNSLMTMRFRVEALAGPELASGLLDYSESATTDAPLSLHYKIRKAHHLVLEARNLESGAKQEQALQAAKAYIEAMQASIEDYQRKLSRALLLSKSTLEELTK